MDLRGAAMDAEEYRQHAAAAVQLSLAIDLGTALAPALAHDAATNPPSRYITNPLALT
ncbi:hypothetical protein HBH98_248970 [Parastagonospora nodorum]|nr:hypothetical protein HBH53_253210 [Parastagonospora nodorum]KAH3956087.1 hypothetical protein HBH51_255830 [Parastagonospora nodorum]KAH4215339.1 hypothetical protein HBI06_255990 [Parastagonospora nodorum]KAH4222575.1 hypothetical protein HBI05_253350 [Parastagonospora nodorum]KAH4333475.1 hypothetical protein HBH98_248970 [Parastagonospora nodorum]